MKREVILTFSMKDRKNRIASLLEFMNFLLFMIIKNPHSMFFIMDENIL